MLSGQLTPLLLLVVLVGATVMLLQLQKRKDQYIPQLLNQYGDWIVFFFLLVASLALRWKYSSLIDLHNNTDYYDYLLPWVERYRSVGFVNGLAEGIGNYYIPYNIFLAFIAGLNVEPWLPIAMLSSIFDYLTAIFIYKIIWQIKKTEGIAIQGKNIKCFSIAFTLLPMVFVNGTILKQCDSIYVCFLIIAIYCLIRNKYTQAFIFVGIAVSFKLQAVFIVPFLILLYVQKKSFSIVEFFWIPLCYLFAGLPAIFCGRSALETYGTYLNQMGDQRMMYVNFQSIYAIGMSDDLVYFHLAIIITLVVLSFAYLKVSQYSIEIPNTLWVCIACWTAFTCVEFLPDMHERYDYLPIILTTILAIFIDHKLILPAIVMQLVSACTYAACVYAYLPNFEVLGIFYFGAYCIVSYDLYQKLKENLKTDKELNAKEGACCNYDSH